MKLTEDHLIEDMRRFYADPLGFVMYAFPWADDASMQVVELQEPYASRYNRKYGPDLWACQMLEQIGEQVKMRKFNGRSPVEPLRMAVASGHGIGKLNLYDMMLPVPNGMVAWGSLKVGDYVFGKNGSATKIIATHHYKNVPMYRVTFDDGSYSDVSSGHLWNVRGRQERRNKLTSWRTLETIDILDRGVKRPNGSALARQWEIPIQGAAQFEEREIDIHPYFMGIWLGDGSKGQPRYCKPYAEIANKLRSLGYDIHDCADGKSFRIQNIMHFFGAEEFQRNSQERYIADDYKFNTVDNRTALFCGLMDSDGEVNISGSIGYSSTSKQLAEDVIWLARSLGCKAMMQPAIKHGWYPDIDGNRIQCKDCYRVTINAPFNPFTLEHRRAAYKPSESRYITRWIDSIEPIGNFDGMCITVENKDGLYLANDFIVTHNSTITAWLVCWIMSTRPRSHGTVTANTSQQLESKTWAEIAKWMKRCITSHWFTVSSGRGSMKLQSKQLPTDWYCVAQTCREENSESFAGQHSVSATSFYIFDEASAIPDKIYEVSQGGLTDGEPMQFAFGNPTRNTGWFRECFGKMKHRWITRQIDSRTVAITNKAELARDVQDYGEDSDYVKVRIRGQFPSVSSSQFISSASVEAAIAREGSCHISDPLVIGVDVARFGDDQSVIAFRKGRDATLIQWQKYRGIDTMLLAAHVVAAAQKHHAQAIFIDGGGVGGGVVDRVRQMGITVVDVQFGAAADYTYASDLRDRYANKRAEMWGNMREWLKGGKIPNDSGLIDGLTGVEYGYNLKQEIQLETKKDMKKRGLASPDEADALCVTFAQPIYPTPDSGYPGWQSSNLVVTDWDPFVD